MLAWADNALVPGGNEQMSGRTAYPRVFVPSGQRLLFGLFVLALPLAAIAQPRIAPLPESQWSDLQREIAESVPGRVTNAIATYLHHPTLARNILPFQDYISSDSTLPARHRELLIFRTAWLCRSNYLWAQRAAAARRTGITEEELPRIALGSEAPSWEPFEAALLRAADELHVDFFVSDETWSALAAR